MPLTPFHPGEITARTRAGAGDVTSRVANFIRPYMPDQHRAFFEALPFVVLAAQDGDSQTWVTILEGEPGFITSPDATTLRLADGPEAQDPLAPALAQGADIGLLGIELSTRRRNRLSGRFHHAETGYAIDVQQSFGNCPKYISKRDWHSVPDHRPGTATRADHLSPDQMARIGAADTLFLGSGQHDGTDAPSNGFDASHRGGAAGFVQVITPSHLRIPDYAGNNFFNTIGNLLRNPHLGAVFVDFATGGLLHLTGRAQIDWEPQDSRDPDARRMIDLTVTQVIDRPGALSLRWTDRPRPT